MYVDKYNKDDCSLSDRGEATFDNIKSKSKTTNIDKLLMNISAFSLQGGRSHMEDFFDIGYQLKPEDQQKPGEWPYEYFYFGIFDGHGGSDAAKYAKENLLRNIVKQPTFWSDEDSEVLRSIEKGYAETHETMRRTMHNWPKTHRYLPSTAGTTASVLFIKNGKYYTGHVGDSRIVISRRNEDSNQWISEQLTEDHKPESDSEIKRIRRAGGDVKSKVGVHRVVWRRPILHSEICGQYTPLDDTSSNENPRANEVASYPICESLVSSYQVIPFLAIGRSLGDFWSINPYSGQYIVSPEPDVACRPIDPNDECILLATDGLWSVINSQQAIRALEEFKAVREDERDNGPYAKQYFTIDNFYNVIRPMERDNYALSLVYLAYQVWDRRSLRSDNITAVVAMLGDILSTQQQAMSCKRSYRTRSISSLRQLSKSSSESSIMQIGRTRKYSEVVRVNQAPSFNIEPLDQRDIGVLERLGNWLMLPPSALPKVRDTSFIPPQNYTRLEKADIRKIDHPLRKGKILIRHVSDDPSDATSRPERASKRSGILVRDSSAQCTQAIYDFALPWPGEFQNEYEDDIVLGMDEIFDLMSGDIDNDRDDDNDDDDDDDESLDDVDEGALAAEMMIDGDEEEEDEDDEGEEAEEDDDEDGDDNNDDDEGDHDDSPIYSPILKSSLKEEDIDADPKALLFDSPEFDDWPEKGDRKNNSGRPNTRGRIRESLRNATSKEHMLQPRSDNFVESPKNRRRTRSGAYLSSTGGPKRKIIQDSPKSKRRKSHPLQCAVSQS